MFSYSIMYLSKISKYCVFVYVIIYLSIFISILFIYLITTACCFLPWCLCCRQLSSHLDPSSWSAWISWFRFQGVFVFRSLIIMFRAETLSYFLVPLLRFHAAYTPAPFSLSAVLFVCVCLACRYVSINLSVSIDVSLSISSLPTSFDALICLLSACMCVSINLSLSTVKSPSIS